MTALPAARAPGPRILHVLEPTILGNYGHHLPFVLHVSQAAARRGWQTLVYVAAEADLANIGPEIHLSPAFRSRYSAAFALAESVQPGPQDHRLWHQLARWRSALLRPTGHVAQENRRWARASRLARWGRHYLPELAIDRATSAWMEAEVGTVLGRIGLLGGIARDCLFVPTSERFLLEALAGKAAEIAALAIPVHFRSWCLQSLESPGFDLLPLMRHTEEALTSRGVATHWHAETQSAARQMEQVLGRPVSLQSSLAFSALVDPPAVDATPDTKGGWMNVLSPGAARRFPDKGIPFLAMLAGHLSTLQGIALTMQEIPQGLFPEEADLLQKSGRVRFLPQVLSHEAYTGAVKKADAIIIAYDHVTWLDATRGSGVLFDALHHGIPLLVRRGLPVLDELEGYEYETFRTPKEAVAILAALATGSGRERFRRNFKKFRQSNHRNAMLEQLGPELKAEPSQLWTRDPYLR